LKGIIGFITIIFIVISSNVYAGGKPGKNVESTNNIYGIVVKDINGKDVNLSSYKGKVLLIVNVARNAVLQNNTADWRQSTKNIKIKVSKYLHSPATILEDRNLVLMKK
jgi:hypothetical protein